MPASRVDSAGAPAPLLPMLAEAGGAVKPAGLVRDPRPVEHARAVAWMEARADAVLAGRAPEALRLLEHPDVYTAGTGARPEELLDPSAPVARAGRGGRWTWHGPGQRVAYVVLDLRGRGRDLRRFVSALEGWASGALAELGLEAAPRPGRVGLWAEGPGGRPAKVASVGVRVRRWVAFHGVSVNRDPDLSRFDAIVPCGVPPEEGGVASLASLGRPASAEALDGALARGFERVFGAALRDEPPPAD